MFFHCTKKMEYPERTNICTGKKYIQKGPRLGFKSRNLLLQGTAASNCTSVQPLRSTKILKITNHVVSAQSWKFFVFGIFIRIRTKNWNQHKFCVPNSTTLFVYLFVYLRIPLVSTTVEIILPEVHTTNITIKTSHHRQCKEEWSAPSVCYSHMIYSH